MRNYNLLLLFIEFFMVVFGDVSPYIDSSRIHRYGSNVFKSGGKIKHSSVRLPSSTEERQTKLPTVKGRNINLELELVHGDILVERPKYSRNKRKVVNVYDSSTRSNTRWPNKIVPYEIDRSVPDEVLTRMQTAIEHWHNRTCIRFEVYSRVRHRNYRSRLRIRTTEASLCASFVGYREDQPMYISDVFLGTDCSTGTIIHELGHAIGFRHEQSRVDRDNHVKINYAMIPEDFRGQYDVMENPQPNYYGVQYDLFSVMHYSNQGGVLRAVDSKRDFLMGQRIGLSFLDSKMANLAYKCDETCGDMDCQNEGFVDQNCKCFCPDGFTGRFCETVVSGDNSNLQTSTDKTVNLQCDFDNTLCSWSQDRIRASDDWVFNTPSAGGFTETQQFFGNKFKTGPQSGDADGKATGTYVYLNSLRKVNKYANTILMSPQISVQKKYSFCLGFWYQMYKDGNNPSYPLDIGNLTVRLMNADGTDSVLWTVKGNQGIDWKYGEADVTISPPASAVYIEAVLVDLSYGDIAIDKITMKTSPCTVRPPSPVQQPAQPTQIQTQTNPPRAPPAKPIVTWGEWSECSTTCGEGMQTRSLECKNVKFSCKSRSETRKCVLNDCPTTKTGEPVEVIWSDWNEWSECSATCDTGYQYRVRTCLSRNTRLCAGERIQNRDCLEKPCDEKKTTEEVEEIAKQKMLLLPSFNETETIDASANETETIDEGDNTASVDEAETVDQETNATITSANETNSKLALDRPVRRRPRPLSVEARDIGADDCGGEYTLRAGQTLSLQSPNYPSQYGANLRCNYYIKSPANTKITTRIVDIDLEESTRDTCIDGLEFRYYSLGQPGPVYCGHLQIKPAFQITSYSNFTLLIFRSNWGQASRRRGFQVEAEISN